jgi:hypothetical protein
MKTGRMGRVARTGLLLLGAAGCAPDLTRTREACAAIELGTRVEALPQSTERCCGLYARALRGDVDLFNCCEWRRDGATTDQCTAEQCAAPEAQASPFRVGGEAEGPCVGSQGLEGIAHCYAWILDGQVAATGFACQD